MSFFGKEYKLERQENFEEFVDAIKPPEEFKKALIAHKPTTKLVKNGDTYTLYATTQSNIQSEVTFKNGVEFDETVQGRPVKTTLTLNGNVLTQEQKLSDGSSFTFKREFSDNELITTITTSLWNGVARRYYKAV